MMSGCVDHLIMPETDVTGQCIRGGSREVVAGGAEIVKAGVKGPHRPLRGPGAVPWWRVQGGEAPRKKLMHSRGYLRASPYIKIGNFKPHKYNKKKH